MSRGSLFWTSLILGTACLVGGTVTFVASRSLFNSRVFAARMARSLSDPAVSAYAADEIASAVVKSRPDLMTVRPLIVGTAAQIVPNEAFRSLVERAARKAHEAAFSETSQRVVLSIPDFQILIREALQQASPEIAAKIPKRFDSVMASLGEGKYSHYLIDLWRLGHRLKWSWPLLVLLGIALHVAAVWLARNRRRALVRVGISLVVAGVLMVAIVPAAVMAAAWIGEPLERGATRGLIRAFFGDFSDWGLFFAGLGVLCAAGAASLLERLDPVSQVVRYSRVLITPPVSPLRRLFWGVSHLLGGGLLILFPADAAAGLLFLTGVFAAYLGIRELFRLFLEHLAGHPVEEDIASGRAQRVGAVAAALGVVILGAAWAFWRNPVVKPLEPRDMACNGYAQLCDKRLNEVVFAGSHNAMSNQQIPGWMFPHQEATIAYQLRDGVRALLFDVHYGFPGASRIKTDTDTEPMMDQVKKAIGEEGFQAALRIRNRLVGVDEKRRGLYLCHGLCELGAYELEPVLRDIRDFLVAHPMDVVLIVVEDYVDTRELGAAFEKAGLGELIYKGTPSPDWPTLRELVESDHRLVLFIESGKPGVPWLRPAFENFRETPYTFHTVADFSCRANRGGDGGSLFLINNWIETTPTPRPSNAAIVNAHDFLLARARQCQQERQHVPNIVAVDFYHTGDLLGVVNELNGVATPPTAAEPPAPAGAGSSPPGR